jgi:hypothetical protein
MHSASKLRKNGKQIRAKKEEMRPKARPKVMPLSIGKETKRDYWREIPRTLSNCSGVGETFIYKEIYS